MDRGPGPALCAGFQPAAQQDQHDNDRRRLEIDRARPFGQQRGREERHEGIEIGRRGADSDKAVHVRCALEQRGKPERVEAAPRPEQDHGGQTELDQPAGPVANGFADQAMHPGDQVRAHFQQEHRQGEGRRHSGPAGQPARLFILAGTRVFPRAVLRQGRGIACVNRRLEQVGDHDRAFEISHRGGFRGQIDVHVQHARHRRQRLVHPPDAGRAGHGGHVQTNALSPDGIADLFQLLDDVRDALRPVDLRLGRLAGEVDANVADTRQAGKPTLHPPNARGAGHVLKGNSDVVWTGHGNLLILILREIRVPFAGRSTGASRNFFGH